MPLREILYPCSICGVCDEGGSSTWGTRADGLYGWSGQILTPDGTEVKENYDDLIRRQWSDHHSALGWNVYTDDPIAEASEVKEFPVAFSPKKTPELIENTRRGFHPRTTERYHPQIRYGAQPTRRAVSPVGHWITGSEIAHKLDKERAEDAGNGAATIKVAPKVDAVSVGQERGTARTTAETGAMRTGATIVVVMDPTATREGMPNVSDLHHHLLELLRLLSRSRRHRPGANTRRINAVTLETRTSQGIIREETVQAPDGTMYTEYTFPDGHTERDYWRKGLI